MRILFINSYYPPDAAGSAYILGELAEDLARSHDVDVVAGRPSYNPEVGTYRPQGVRVARVPSTSFGRHTPIGRALNYLTFAVFSAARACLMKKPDVVVTMTDPPIIGLIGVVTATRFRRPFVQLTHDVFPDIAIALGKVTNPVVVRLWRALNRAVTNRAVKIVVVGRDMREKLEREGVDAGKLVFLPTWARVQATDSDDVQRLREQMGWKGAFVVMHAGNMGLPQNLGTLVEAADRLRDQDDVILVFVGDGAVKGDLVRTVERRNLSNVVFLSYRPKEEAQALMAAADVHIVSLIPGLWGCATPSKMYGVMAAGRPFIAAVDAGSEPARIVEEYGCGLHVPAGDAEELARAILEIRERTDELGQRAKKAFIEKYQRDTVTAATKQLLEEVAAAPYSGSPAIPRSRFTASTEPDDLGD